jgi:hypothetical protein
MWGVGECGGFEEGIIIEKGLALHLARRHGVWEFEFECEEMRAHERGRVQKTGKTYCIYQSCDFIRCLGIV